VEHALRKSKWVCVWLGRRVRGLVQDTAHTESLELNQLPIEWIPYYQACVWMICPSCQM
jgi:hypothetical protein